MVQLDQDKSTQCAVHDQTPDSEQKKINIVVRPAHTVEKVISNIKTQYRYDNFELVLQPISGGDLVYLNDRTTDLIYEVDGFEPKLKNNLVLIPTGKWDGNVKSRYELPKPKLKSLTNGSVAKKSSSTKSTANADPAEASVVKKLSPKKSTKSSVSTASVTDPTTPVVLETTTTVSASPTSETLVPEAMASKTTTTISITTQWSPTKSSVETSSETKDILTEAVTSKTTSVARKSSSTKSSEDTPSETLANEEVTSKTKVSPVTKSSKDVPSETLEIETVTSKTTSLSKKSSPTKLLKDTPSGTKDILTETLTTDAVTSKKIPVAKKSSPTTSSETLATEAVTPKTTSVTKKLKKSSKGTPSEAIAAEAVTPKMTSITKKKSLIKSSENTLSEALAPNAVASKTTAASSVTKKSSPSKSTKSSVEGTTTTFPAATTTKSEAAVPAEGTAHIPIPPPPPPPPASISSPAEPYFEVSALNKFRPDNEEKKHFSKLKSELLDICFPSTNSNGNSINRHDVGLSPPSSMTTVTNATNSDSLNLSPMSEPDPLSDDDLALGASASPTETDPIVLAGDLQTDREVFESASFGRRRNMTVATPPPTNNGYVGLVNQAMTCYLNSLLQALYMTPEFRNALYRWEFDNDNEAKNIPYQLQKLFLNLQTSKKSAVETTDLTRSFGWNSSEAWQQHDIQELCRVMFDALEHKFKNTKQANLIASLYEGKMIDYVKCLECNTEKTRADTFLDIPLPVRPFGSQVAYGSIEEALRAFVQPETLDGNNQYFCEKCNKKCDAHKGLKFKNFPYVLTLHLKRFDFDYTTMYRIKLNDKVTFPQVLNLNSFIDSPDSEGANSNGVDDCSTTDSGSAMEEDNWSSGVATTASSMTQNETDINEEDFDDGIDMFSNTEHRNRANSDQNIKQDLGPYTYELFAIMIHSGSASGGHYYAYIKELDNNEWFCFNDQTVSPITQEDIQKSFGGGSSKAYYSSVYSSSTNAYMLMYRQVDEKRNEKSMKADDFPEHITKHMEKLKEDEENRVTRSSLRHRPITDLSLTEQINPRVYFYNPLLKKLKMTRLYVSQNVGLDSVLKTAYTMLSIQDFAPQTHCRLVGYDPPAEKIVRSFENEKNPSLTDVRANCEDTLEFLLEYRADDQEFEIYEPGGDTWYVFVVKLATMEMDGPFFVYSIKTFENNDALRHSIAVRLNLKEDQLMVATTQRQKKAFVTYDTTPTMEAQQRFEELARAQFKDITYMYVNVPNTDPTNLEIIGIPAIEMSQEKATTECPIIAATPAPSNGIANANNNDCNKLSNGFHHECNSEDSSLSDGDRTLVENLIHRSGVSGGGGGGDSQSSTSHSPQLSSPEDESKEDSFKRINAFYKNYFHTDSDQATADQLAQAPKFFHAIKLDIMDTVTTSNKHQYSDPADGAEEVARKPVVTYKVLVDSHMKLGQFKQHIQHLIQVPDNYFQINRKHEKSLKGLMNQSLVYFCEGETLSVDLGVELQPDEHKAKIFFMRLSELNNETGRLPCVCEWIYTDAMTVPAAKAALVSKLKHIDPAKYKTLTVENCRLWLKGGRSLIKIFSDEDDLGCQLRSSSTTPEYLIQECENGIQPQVDDASLMIFVRQWHPDTLALDEFQEITLGENSDIRSVLSKLSSIPEENVAYTKVNGQFPYTTVSLLTINSAMNWSSMPATLDNYPLSSSASGNLYFYKNSITEPKELSPEERREMSAKERSRLDNLGGMSTSRYSPRRERALKIYLDSPATTASPPVDANSSMADD